MMIRIEHDVETGEIKEIQLSADEIKQIEAQWAADAAAWTARKAAEQG